MEIRLILMLFVVSSSTLIHSQTEEQRKYAVENFKDFKSFILSPEKDKPLLTHFHSKDTYLDVYLDTPEKLLFKNNLSLRFRKRILDSITSASTYSFQLKSEMDSINSVRMEVEEKEIDFYLVKSNSGWVKLTDILDTIFFYFENYSESSSSNGFENAIALIQSWIQFKTDGPIAPFQKLLHLGFSSEVIKTLKPEFFGKSARYRSHVYTKQNSTVLVDKNKVKNDKLPKFFQAHKEFNWLLESSLDNTIFYKKIGSQIVRINIREYEVENKYYQSLIGSSMLALYEDYLMKYFDLQSKMDSKYKQAVILFSEL